MFEVYKRHRPVFAVAAVQRMARLMTDALPFGDPALARSGVEILPITQTARINEDNSFVAKSTLSHDAVLTAVKENPAFWRLSDGPRSGEQLLTLILSAMIDRFEIDSCLCFGEGPFPSLSTRLAQASSGARKPLLLFSVLAGLDYAAIEPRWLDDDLPAIWLGRNWTSAMEGTEAFFAISPELKLEVALNRYQPLASFGDFAVGMVRL
jgi:hypothetical protein